MDEVAQAQCGGGWRRLRLIKFLSSIHRLLDEERKLQKRDRPVLTTYLEDHISHHSDGRDATAAQETTTGGLHADPGLGLYHVLTNTRTRDRKINSAKTEEDHPQSILGRLNDVSKTLFVAPSLQQLRPYN